MIWKIFYEHIKLVSPWWFHRHPLLWIWTSWGLRRYTGWWIGTDRSSRTTITLHFCCSWLKTWRTCHRRWSTQINIQRYWPTFGTVTTQPTRIRPVSFGRILKNEKLKLMPTENSHKGHIKLQRHLNYDANSTRWWRWGFIWGLPRTNFNWITNNS